MIPSSYVYNGVNLILGVVCLISIILAFKMIPDKRVRLFLIIAAVLIIVSGGLMSFCLNVFKMLAPAEAADFLRINGSTDSVKKVLFFKDLSLLGNLFEVVALGLFAGIAKRLVSLKGIEETEGEAAQ